jgi:HEAT repeat protein
MASSEEINGWIQQIFREGYSYEAIAALGSAGPDAIPPLLDALRQPVYQGDPRDVAEALMIALVNIGPAAVNPLIEALDEERISWPAAWVLGRIGDRRATEPVSRLLQAKDRVRREMAVTALGDLGDPAAVEPLIVALKDRSPAVASSAAKVLAELGDPRAIEPLRHLEKSRRPELQRAARESIARLQGRKEGQQ